jgi:molybdopterin synthase catalytic subunit
MSKEIKISVQEKDFSVEDELRVMRANPKAGAVVMFVGTVRDLNEGVGVKSLTLEYYPGMTEKALKKIADAAQARWDLEDITVIHRVGRLEVTDQIVFVAVSSMHRGEAFDACEFIMDFLKTEAPFWKREETVCETRWVEARDSDDAARDAW